MQKVKTKRTGLQNPGISGLRWKEKDRKKLQTSLKLLNKLADRLGLLDPMDTEPATIFAPLKGKR